MRVQISWCCFGPSLALFATGLILFVLLAVPDIQDKQAFEEGWCVNRAWANASVPCQEIDQCAHRDSCVALRCESIPLDLPGTYICCSGGSHNLACRIQVGQCQMYWLTISFDGHPEQNQTLICPLSSPTCYRSAMPCYSNGHTILFTTYELSRGTLAMCIIFPIMTIICLLGIWGSTECRKRYSFGGSMPR